VSGTDIFLSYARADRATARTFAQCLAQEGFSVWWDASLHSGETFDEVIEQRLRDAKAVVVLWSPRSVASRWVRAEATLADRRNKLVPAIIEPCDRPIVFELTHTAELAGWAGDRSNVEWRNFVDDLDRLVRATDGAGARGVPQAPAPAAPPPSRQPLRPGNDQIISAERYRREQPAEVTQEPAPPVEVHCLEILEGELPEATIVIDSSSVKLGRTAPSGIVIPHRSVSREHCVIGLANDELLVTDLNSTNGTYIDGERIARATILPIGSVLGVGQISLRHAVRSNAETGEGSAQALRAVASH
jgi:hypothetical protein